MKPYVIYFSLTDKQCKDALLIIKKRNIVDKFEYVNVKEKKPPSYITHIPSLVQRKNNKMLKGKGVIEFLGGSVERNMERTIEKNVERTIERNVERSTEKNVERRDNKKNKERGRLNEDTEENGLLRYSENTFSDSYAMIVNDNKDEIYNNERGTKKTSDELFYKSQRKLNGHSTLDEGYNFKIKTVDESPTPKNKEEETIESIMKRVQFEDKLRDRMR